MYGYLKCALAKRGTEAQAGSRRRVVPLATMALLAFATVVSADPAVVGQNLAKYWSYRSNQRTKYIRVGTCQGCSMVSSWRSLPEAQMSWGDATLDQGWYIGALATEHYMLSNPGTFPGYSTGGGDLNVCRDELQKALAALNRVDATAENSFQAGFPDTPGFFIRDDVPDDFYQFFPNMTNIFSDYSNPDWWAKEMSQDQVCHILLGLTLVKQLIPAGLVVNGMDLRATAIQRGAAIVDWTHQHGWIIYNPVTNAAVTRGPDARVFAKGFNGACVYLTDGAVNFNSSISGFYSSLWNGLSSPSNPAYDNYNNRHMAMVLSAEANGWGNGTLNALMSLADPYDWYAYPMLYAILYPSIAQAQGTWAGHRATMNTVVQGQLNLAPVSGPHEPTSPAEENTGWCADRKFIRNLNSQNIGGASDGYEYPGLDYLVLHNLFYIMTPSNWENPSPGTQSPYAGVIQLPGTVQAENFDNGGQGVAYNDLSGGNAGGAYRSTDVDIEVTTDTGGGHNVGWIDTGEWLEYTVNVASAGTFNINARVASPNTGGSYHIEFNGNNVTGTKTVPNTGGWQTYTTVTSSNVSLSAGQQIMRVFVDSGAWNFNYVSIQSVQVPQSPFGGTARAIPGVIQAEDFDNGGEDTAYNDNDAGNNGGQYRTGDNVDIEATTDTGGGYNVGWTGAGEWLEYTVNVNTTGDYAIRTRLAAGGAGGTFQYSLDGANITAAKTIATTGGWQTWTTIIVPGVALTAGNNKVLRFTVVSGDFNINNIEFTFGGADVVSIDLASTNFEDGMTAPIGGDGDTVGDTIGGHACRKNMDPGFNDRYFYFGVTDIYAFQGNKNSATITVDYYDSGTQTLVLEYDSTSAAYTGGGTIVLGNTNTWKTATFNLTNVYFGNRQNNGSDFRIYTGGNFTVRLDTVMVFATTSGPVTLNNSAFPSNADGWNVVVWKAGQYENGTMVWASSGGNPTGNMLSNGSGGSNNTDSCTREGGEINKAVSTAGYNSQVQVVYDVRFETNQTGTTCSGSCPVLEGNCADKLAVYYSTAGTAGPWTLLEAVNALSVTQNVWSTRTINCPAAANNKANFAVRFRWQFNSSTDGGRLDNVKVIATP